MVSIDYDLLNLSMSLEDKIHKKLSTLEKYGEISLQSSDIRKRVLDPNTPVKDFDDAIELGMYGAYELSDYDNFKFLEQFKGIELSLEKSPAYTKMAQSLSGLRKNVMESTGLLSIIDVNKALKDNPTYKSIIDGQNQLREQAFKLIQPNQEFTDAIKRITQITDEHKRVWNERIAPLKQEVENVEVKITKLTPPLEFKDGGRVPSLEELAMQVEVLKSERDMHSAELERTALLLKKIDEIEVSDWYKQHVKDSKRKHIIPDETRPITGEREDTRKMKAHMVQVYAKRKAIKKGRYIADEVGDEDKRRPKYSDPEIFKYIKDNHYPNKSVSTIADYIKNFDK